MDNRPRPIKRANRRNQPEFRETLGSAMPMPADLTPATYMTIGVALAAAVLAILMLIVLNLVLRPIAPEVNPPGGAILTLDGTSADLARVQQARAISTTPGARPGEQTGVPAVSSMSSGYGDTYMLQGSSGIPAASQ